MKVILLRDVPKLGKKGEVKEVADGFAYNNLIPRKLVAPATTANVEKVQRERLARDTALKHKDDELRRIEAETASNPLIIEVAANEQGHLFKGVQVVDIIRAIKDRFGTVLSDREVQLPQPLKSAGMHDILCIHGPLTVHCRVTIVPKK